jgi:hypothetical protein
MLKRPGFQTSEWGVALLTGALNLVNNSQHWTSWRGALLPTLAAVAYIVSRGLAKYEPRAQVPPA